MPIPLFNDDGNLPPGLHEASLEEIEAQFGWNSNRRELLIGLWRVLLHLKEARCEWAYLNGSFVTRKHTPADFDLCWQELGVEESQLPQVFFDFTQKRAAQKRQFSGEIFPATAPGGPDGRSFLDFFQRCKRTNHRKGIIAIKLESVTGADLRRRLVLDFGEEQHDQE